MPINNTVDKDKKIVYSICNGVMTKGDFDLYINTIWSVDDHFGFNELFDTVDADWSEFDFSYLFDIAKTAASLTTIDSNSKLAWVVLEGKQKELTDFYKAAKSLTSGQNRTLEAFYTKEDAMTWLEE